MSDLFQSVPFAVVLLIIGFVFLVKGADAFVEGCSSIARRYHVPSLIIGMTIVAMGTSLPETAVSVTAAVTGNNALAVSNAVGSNIFNLMVVVGACTLFTSVAVQINTLKIDFPISILCAILLLILGAAGMSLGRPLRPLCVQLPQRGSLCSIPFSSSCPFAAIASPFGRGGIAQAMPERARQFIGLINPSSAPASQSRSPLLRSRAWSPCGTGWSRTFRTWWAPGYPRS